MKKFRITPESTLLNISKENGGCFLFMGKKGLGKASKAREIAAQLLDCKEERLLVHPDYMYLSPEGARLKVEEMEKMKDFVSLVPAMAAIKVVIIDDAESMTNSAQNTILKLLEDDTQHVVVILIAHGEILDTICSRCQRVYFDSLGMEEMVEVANNMGQVHDLALRLCDGRPGMYKQMIQSDTYLNDVANILNVFFSATEPWKVFDAFHILKEKDTSSFFEKYDSDFILATLDFMRQGCAVALQKKCGLAISFFDDVSGLEAVNTLDSLFMNCQMIEQAESAIRNKLYSKNDFFNLIDKICCTAPHECAERR